MEERCFRLGKKYGYFKSINISNLNENTGTYELAIDGILRTEVASLTSISGGTILAGNNYVICNLQIT